MPLHRPSRVMKRAPFQLIELHTLRAKESVTE